MEADIDEPRWFFSASEIRPGASAVLGGNRLAFNVIHHVALCTITVSILSSIFVVLKISTLWKSTSGIIDFTLRFPLYLAIVDILWGISHFLDHMYLVTVQKYPESKLVTYGLSMNLWFFFGYQHLMHASVSAYTYFRIVHRTRLDLGFWEWKLHIICLTFLAVSVTALYFLGSFGHSAYWMGTDITSSQGMVLGGLAAMTASLNAICTTFGYLVIRRKVLASLVRSNEEAVGGIAKCSRKKQSTATRCLSIYVRIAACIYCPLAVILWTGLIAYLIFGVLEPFTPFFTVIVANSSGWANAYGYYRCEKIRKERMKEKLIKIKFSTTSKQTDESDDRF